MLISGLSCVALRVGIIDMVWFITNRPRLAMFCRMAAGSGFSVLVTEVKKDRPELAIEEQRIVQLGLGCDPRRHEQLATGMAAFNSRSLPIRADWRSVWLPPVGLRRVCMVDQLLLVGDQFLGFLQRFIHFAR